MILELKWPNISPKNEHKEQGSPEIKKKIVTGNRRDLSASCENYVRHPRPRNKF